MSKKKRVFDIDFDEENVSVPAGTDGTETRRGPMAAAISENAEALTERQKAEDAIRVENDALAIARAPQVNKPGLAVKLFEMLKRQKQKNKKGRS